MSETRSETEDAAPDIAPLTPEALDQLFREARTPKTWARRDVSHDTVVALYDLLKLAPTSGNCSPARFVFLTTDDARSRMKHTLSAGNVETFMSAPLVALVCHDPLFFEQLPRLNAEPGLRDWFAADVGLSEDTAFRNGTLQGAYLIMAARALGLAAAPMSGFDSFAVEDTLLTDTGWRANFIVALGYPDENVAPGPRALRLRFDEACLCL